jgi:V8-like Glu-specific endopeptidase
MTSADAAKLLTGSVVQMSVGNRGICTASKISPSTFLTAAHCARSLSDDFRLIHNIDTWSYQFIKSITITVAEKEDGKRKEDWAILHTETENKDLAALQIGCNEKVYLGMPVAYAGYSNPVDFAFSVGYVASVNKITKSGSNSDFLIDVQASAGASGSPIISLDTGRIIGILIEGIRTPQRGFFLVGIESIRSLSLCDGKTPKAERRVLNSPF